MRFIRMIFLAVLAIVLVVIAFANRGVVAVRLVPEELAWVFGGRDLSLNLPLFLVVLLALLVGMVLGLVWEWLRESQLRRESARRAFHLARLEREARPHVPPSDDVLALLERAPAPKGDAGQGALVAR